MNRILLLMCIMAGISAQAQVEVDFGVKAGVNFAHQHVVNSGSTSLPGNRTSFHGGFYMHVKKGRFGLQPELTYSLQGGNYDFPNLNYVGGYHTEYFSMPLLFTYSASKILTLQLGPQLSVLNSAKQTINGRTTDVRYLYKTGDFGVAVGFALALPHGLQVGARYVAGMRDINNGNVGGPGSRTTNGVAQIYLSYKLSSMKIYGNK